MDGFDATTGELYLDLKTYLVDDIMVKVDRMSMAASLEAREPLLDHKLVEFAFRLPGDFKLHGSTTKWIFKKTLERLLPPETLYRKKEGFSIPIKHWLASELRDLMEETLSEKRLREGGWFDSAHGPPDDRRPCRRPGKLQPSALGAARLRDLAGKLPLSLIFSRPGGLFPRRLFFSAGWKRCWALLFYILFSDF